MPACLLVLPASSFFFIAYGSPPIHRVKKKKRKSPTIQQLTYLAGSLKGIPPLAMFKNTQTKPGLNPHQVSQILITSMERNLGLFLSREDSLLLAPEPIPNEGHCWALLGRVRNHSWKQPHQPAGPGSQLSTFYFPHWIQRLPHHLHCRIQMATLLASKMGPPLMVPNTTKQPDCPWHLIQRSTMPRRTREVGPFLPASLCNLWIPHIF